MAKQYRNLSFVIIGIVVLTGFLSCMSPGRPVAVTDEMAEQIALIKLYVPGPDEDVKTLEIYRNTRKKYVTDLIRDLNYYEKGVWYNEHQDKIVSIKPIEKIFSSMGSTVVFYWRIEYVD